MQELINYVSKKCVSLPGDLLDFQEHLTGHVVPLHGHISL